MMLSPVPPIYWIGLIIRRIVEVDEFIAELWRVHLKVKEEGYSQVRRQLHLRLSCNC